MLKVRKRDGYVEDFKKDKIIATCMKAGGSYDSCYKIANEIENKFKGIVDSKDILNYVVYRLKQLGEYEASLLYPLKDSLYRLDGKEFEWYVARLLELEGYEIEKKDGMTLKGECINHEIDILAKKEDIVYVIECKHHDDIKILTDITATLKHYARYLDVKYLFKKSIPMLVTNTKFTPPSIRYSRCKGMVLLGWNVPKNNGINSIIEKHKAYPLTMLKIPHIYRKVLLQYNITTTLDLKDNIKLVKDKIPKRYIEIAESILNLLY